MKLLFVVQRYGLEVDGGAELYCRWLAEKANLNHQVTVLTTTAQDYITWANQYTPGRTSINGVEVIRMAVEFERHIESFNALTDRILTGQTLEADSEDEWLRAQGPWSPQMIEYIRQNHLNYDLLIFVTYLYAPTVYGSKIAPEKSLLIPTAHDEPVASFAVFRELYHRIRGLLYLTEAEKNYVESMFGVQDKPNILLGTGINLPEPVCSAREIDVKYGIFKPFLLYMGRIEPGKGCADLVKNFLSYRRNHPSGISLVLAGRLHMPLPEDPSIRYIGFVPDGDIQPLISASSAVVVPSPYESLSILLLQAFACGKPVIANATSPVLLAHCLNSNGGLYYADEDEFIEALDLILGDENLRHRLGENGTRYIQTQFTWDRVLERFENFLQRF
ncbi:glycosyltransferase family 4 protein [bacterium]|nr:glycosyltransferase family 4 protein [candidate division CSSED10-310 bacterium]